FSALCGAAIDYDQVYLSGLVGCSPMSRKKCQLPHPPHLHPPLTLLRIVLCRVPVDRLLAVLDHCHDCMIRPAPEPFLIDHESAAHRIKEPGRLLNEVLVVTTGWMRDPDEVIHASQDSEEKANMTGLSLTPPQRCWYSSDLYTPQMRRILKHLPGNREGR